MEQPYHNPDQPNKEVEISQPTQPKSKRKAIIWIILGVVILIGASSFAYFYGSYQARQNYYDAVGDDVAYPADSVYVDGWASPEDYATWKDATFTIPEYDGIPTPFKRGIVKVFLDNGYLGKDVTDLYFFTKIKDRAYRVIAYGNFTGQNEREMAFLLENSDYESSAIFIIPQKGNVLYWKKLPNELPTIKSFKKGALIYMDKMELVPAPVDGIIRQTKNSKYVLIYNQQTKTFSEYYQYTNEDIKSAREEEKAIEDDEEVPDSTDVEQ